MPLSYAGVTLIDPTPDLLEDVRDWIDPSWLTEWTDRSRPGFRQEHLGYRGAWPTQPNRIGVLNWPAGASRFAYGHFLAHHDMVNAIRAEISSDYSGYAANFVMSDGVRSMTTPLYCLPPRPLNRVSRANTSALYLLTLVDDRYRWWYAPGNITVTAGTTTWEELFAAISTALGVSITVGSILSDYLYPDELLTSRYRALPILLDAVAFSVGQRIVRKLDGGVYSMTPDTSLVTHNNNLARETSILTDTNGRLAGHELDLLVGV